MIAPPWLKIPPDGYGAIEYILEYLSEELPKLGVEIVLFTIGATKLRLKGVKKLYYYQDEQYEHIHKTLYDAVNIPLTQSLFALNAIKKAGDFDIIHDHTFHLGGSSMAHLDPRLFPPALCTLHGAFSTDGTLRQGLPDNRSMFAQLGGSERLYFAGISHSQLKNAPRQLKPRLLGVVYNAVKLSELTFRRDKSDYFITLARFNRDKGQHVAIKLCDELGYKLKMAGVVAGLTTPRQLLLELVNPISPYRHFADFKYYSDEILPRLTPDQIEYVGNVSGQRKISFINRAKALLFPIDWEEPFGVAVTEALACGTPVVAMRRGAMPEIIEHGVNGWLADSETEFKEYMTRVDEIDPAACRRSVEEKFSAPTAARAYLAAYRRIIARHKGSD